MAYDFFRMSYLFLPLIGGAIFHGICMRYHWLAFLAKPIDFHATFRGRRIFGEHKTFRGVIAFGIGTALVLTGQAHFLNKVRSFQVLATFDYSAMHSWLLGFSVGVAAMLSELPNSFIKRQLNIPPGATARGICLPIFYILDQVDLVVGAWLVLSLVTRATLERIIISVVIVFFMHQVINILGYFFGMRDTFR
jgi:hypothetical protein